MARRPGAPAAYGEDFSFVSPLVKYLLFFFNMLFVYPAPWWRREGGGAGDRAGGSGPGKLRPSKGHASYTKAAGSATAACWRRAPSAAAQPTSSSCFSSGAS